MNTTTLTDHAPEGYGIKRWPGNFDFGSQIGDRQPTIMLPESWTDEQCRRALDQWKADLAGGNVHSFGPAGYQPPAQGPSWL